MNPEREIPHCRTWVTRMVEKREALVRHLLQFVTITHHHAQLILSVGRSVAYKTILDLKQRGLVCSVSAPSVKGDVVCLTKSGVALARESSGPKFDDLDYPSNPSQISDRTLIHDLAATHVLIRDWTPVPYPKGMLSERELRRHIAINSGRKVPDGMIVTKVNDQNYRVCYEIQESREPEADIERTISNYADMINEGFTHKVIFCSSKPSILERIQSVLAGEIRQWSYNHDHKRHYPMNDCPSRVTDEMRKDSFEFREISDVLKLFIH